MLGEMLMESRLLKILVVLGVPGVALGVFYLLLKQFGFEFSRIGSNASAIIAMTFLLLVGGITFFALHRWGPSKGQQYDSIDRNTKKRGKDHQKTIPNLEGLKEMINGLSKTNRQLLLEIARSPSSDGQYVSDLALNENLMLSRGEIVYRGKELESNGFLEILLQTDQRFRFSQSVLHLVDHNMDFLKSLLVNDGESL